MIRGWLALAGQPSSFSKAMAKRNKPAEEPAKPAAIEPVTDSARAETPENVEQSPEPEDSDEEGPEPPTESESVRDPETTPPESEGSDESGDPQPPPEKETIAPAPSIQADPQSTLETEASAPKLITPMVAATLFGKS